MNTCPRVSTTFPVIDDICNADVNPEGVLGLFRDRAVTAERLALACRSYGHKISASTIRTYRRYYETKMKEAR